MFWKLLVFCQVAAALALLAGRASGGPIHYPEEVRLANVRQLTFGGSNAEAYFGFDSRYISFQASNFGYECDQIFRFELAQGDTLRSPPQLVSTGTGRTTCSFLYPAGDMVLFASTYLGGAACPPKACANGTVTDPIAVQLCKEHAYIWPIYSSYDVFVRDLLSWRLTRLTDAPGYDAEGTISPNGRLIVYTSISSGDLELWTMNLDGTNKRQVTNILGYDGGAFFSPDSQRLLFRAYHPTEAKEQEIYIHLRNAGLVMPTQMELFSVNVDGSDMQQLTALGGSNWAPYYHPDAHRIIFSSNYRYARGYPFNLFLIDERNTSAKPERVTYDADFDSFPMFSRDGSQLIWASGRNATQPGELNLFIADWVDKPHQQPPRQTRPQTPTRVGGRLRHAASPNVRRYHRMRDNNERSGRRDVPYLFF